MNWKNISFFPFDGKFSTLEPDLDTSSKGFRIDSPQIFTIRIMIISCLRALFGSRFFMIFAVSSSVKEMLERQLFVFFLREPVGSLLVQLTIVHCLAEKLSKVSSFCLKSLV